MRPRLESEPEVSEITSEVSERTKSKRVVFRNLSETLGLGIGATDPVAEEPWEIEQEFSTQTSILRNAVEKPFETLATVGITGTDPFRDWDKYLPLDTELVNTDTLSPGRGDVRRQEIVNSGGRLFPDASEEAHDRAIEDIYQEFLRQRHSSSAFGGAEPPRDPKEGESF